MTTSRPKLPPGLLIPDTALGLRPVASSSGRRPLRAGLASRPTGSLYGQKVRQASHGGRHGDVAATTTRARSVGRNGARPVQSSPAFSGYLTQRSQGNRSVYRNIILEKGVLSVLSHRGVSVTCPITPPKLILDLADVGAAYSVTPAGDVGVDGAFTVSSRDRAFHFVADTQSEGERWVSKLLEALRAKAPSQPPAGPRSSLTGPGSSRDRELPPPPISPAFALPAMQSLRESSTPSSTSQGIGPNDAFSPEWMQRTKTRLDQLKAEKIELETQLKTATLSPVVLSPTRREDIPLIDMSSMPVSRGYSRQGSLSSPPSSMRRKSDNNGGASNRGVSFDCAPSPSGVSTATHSASSSVCNTPRTPRLPSTVQIIRGQWSGLSGSVLRTEGDSYVLKVSMLKSTVPDSASGGGLDTTRLLKIAVENCSHPKAEPSMQALLPTDQMKGVSILDFVNRNELARQQQQQAQLNNALRKRNSKAWKRVRNVMRLTNLMSSGVSSGASSARSSARSATLDLPTQDVLSFDLESKQRSEAERDRQHNTLANKRAFTGVHLGLNLASLPPREVLSSRNGTNRSQQQDHPEASKVKDYLFLGSVKAAEDASLLKQLGITHIVNASRIAFDNFFECAPSEADDSPAISYFSAYFLDRKDEPITSILYHVIHFIDDVRRCGGRVLVHCHRGVSRSATLVLAYLIIQEVRRAFATGDSHGRDSIVGKSGKAILESSLERLQRCRSKVDPNVGFTSQMMDWCGRLRGASSTASRHPLHKLYMIDVHGPLKQQLLVPVSLPIFTVGFMSDHDADSHRSTLLLPGNCLIFQSDSSLVIWAGDQCSAEYKNAARLAVSNILLHERTPARGLRLGSETVIVDSLEVTHDSDLFWDALRGVRHHVLSYNWCIVQASAETDLPMPTARSVVTSTYEDSDSDCPESP